MLLSISSIPRY